ncbi:unnamed protein product [Clavelina lepadiformis]|uniref:Uncharacterized protein n=1 Tax=Clavelina lepadiformis TaxID=159417 RepID=A0ABP0FM75_CLALP
MTDVMLLPTMQGQNTSQLPRSAERIYAEVSSSSSMNSATMNGSSLRIRVVRAINRGRISKWTTSTEISCVPGTQCVCNSSFQSLVD